MSLASIAIPSGSQGDGASQSPEYIHRFRYRVADAKTLPFPDASFDLVTCQTLLIHLADPSAVIAEMARVARPGGLVLAAEPRTSRPAWC